MESIDKLRELACDINGNEIVDHMQIYPSCVFDGAWLDAWHRAFDKELEALEREIEVSYMLLPVDADGVLIDLGDKLIEHEDGHEFTVDGVKIWGSTYEWWAYEDGGVQAPATRCTHVKPRTLEDVLIEYRLKAYNLYADQELTGDERVGEFKKLDAEYDSEIRELLGGEGDKGRIK